MHYIETDGYIYRLSNKAYKQLEHALKTGADFNLDKLGKLVAQNPTNLYQWQLDLTDQNEEQDED